MEALIFGAIVLFVIFIYKTIFEPLQYWKKLGIPHDKPLPIFGNLIESILRKKAIAHIHKELYDKYSNHRYFGYFMFNTPSLVVRDPELVKQICIKDFNSFSDHREFLPPTADPFWNQILFARKGRDWKEFRKIVAPAFSQSKMKLMFLYMTQCAKCLLENIKDAKGTLSMDMNDVMAKFSNDFAVNTAFGIDCDSFKDTDNDFYKIGRHAFIIKSFRGLKFFGAAISTKFANIFKITFFDELTKDFYRTQVKNSLEYREKNNIIRVDLLHLLKEAQKGRLKYDKEDKQTNNNKEFSVPEDNPEDMTDSYIPAKISDDDILVSIMGLFFTNFESVTTYMCNTVYEIAINPDVQEKLIKEVDETWKKCGGDFTYDHLLSMKYLDMVCSESIRLRSPTVFLDRVVTKPYTIPPVLPHEKPLHLKPGQDITLPAYCFLRDPEYFPNPDKFDPERFNDVNKHSVLPQTFLPFGYGPRSCMGSRLVLVQVKLIIFYFLLRFRFVPIDKTPIPFTLDKMSLSQTSEHGYWLGAKPRDDVQML